MLCLIRPSLGHLDLFIIQNLQAHLGLFLFLEGNNDDFVVEHVVAGFINILENWTCEVLLIEE